MTSAKKVQARFNDVSGELTIRQKIDGPDETVSFTSTIPANTTFSLRSANGVATKTIKNLRLGSYQVVAGDVSSAGYSLTDISCNDSDSSANVSQGTAEINLSANEHVTCSFEFRESRIFTSRMIADYLGARNTLLLDNQPSRDKRITKLKRHGSGNQSTGNLSAYGINLPGILPFNVEFDKDNFSFSSSLSALTSSGGRHGGLKSLYPSNGKWDIRVEGKFSRFDDKSSNGGSFGIVYAGVDYLIKPDVLVGLIFQYDRLKQKYAENDARVKGAGWMIGPYASLRLGDSYYFDVRAAWGRSRNKIKPFGSYEDDFKTRRWMVSTALVGDWQYGDWTIRPGVSFQYIEEKQLVYTDSTNILIPSQTVSQGDIRLGPRISYKYSLDDGRFLVPWVQFEGVYGFGKRGEFSVGSLAYEAQGLTGRVEAGLNLDLENGVAFSTSGKYTGIGSRAKSYGLSMELNYQF